MSEVFTYRVRQGGLMRCCLLTLDDAMAELIKIYLPQPAIGERVSCGYCSDWMIRADDGAWEWDHE